MHQRFQRLRPLQLERQLEAIAHVALALGGHGHIDRQHQGAEIGVARAPDHICGNLSVARRVELIPGMRGRHLGRRFDRSGGSARHDERNIGGGRRPREYQVGVSAKQRRQASRRDAEWAREALSEERGGLVAPCDVDHVTRHQAMAREAFLVGRDAVLVLDAALDEVEGDPWQPPPGEAAQVVDIHCLFDFHRQCLTPILRISDKQNPAEDLLGIKCS